MDGRTITVRLDEKAGAIAMGLPPPGDMGGMVRPLCTLHRVQGAVVSMLMRCGAICAAACVPERATQPQRCCLLPAASRQLNTGHTHKCADGGATSVTVAMVVPCVFVSP